MANPLHRRTFLRGSGVAFALPLLEAMRPSLASDARGDTVPRRMIAIQTNMGILPQFFFPEQAGQDYSPGPYLQRLAAHRQNMTVFSGVNLPGVTGGHAAERCFLTGAPHPERGGFRNGVSLHQYAAEQIGNQTRYPSLDFAGDQSRRLNRAMSPADQQRLDQYFTSVRDPTLEPLTELHAL